MTYCDICATLEDELKKAERQQAIHQSRGVYDLADAHAVTRARAALIQGEQSHVID